MHHKSKSEVLCVSPLNGLRPWQHSELYTSYRAVRISEQLLEAAAVRISDRCKAQSSATTLWRESLHLGALDLATKAVEHLCQLSQGAARSGNGCELSGLIHLV